MQQNKHLTALEFLKDRLFSTSNIDMDILIEAMTEYHDYALDRAADEMKVMVVINNAERELICDNMTFALHRENRQLVVPDLNSILNLKHNK